MLLAVAAVDDVAVAAVDNVAVAVVDDVAAAVVVVMLELHVDDCPVTELAM